MKRTENFSADPTARTAQFGFREVDIDAKSGLVRGVFDSVAGRYDLMNDLMSGGIHRLWKASLIDQLRPRPGMHLLDVAGGTGDIAFRFLDAGGGEVTVCDINQSMIAVGRDRAIDKNRLAHIDWLAGDAEALPIPRNSVDAYTIAFGLRNVTRIDEALREAHRVLRPGGRFLCLSSAAWPIPFWQIYMTDSHLAFYRRWGERLHRTPMLIDIWWKVYGSFHRKKNWRPASKLPDSNVSRTGI